MKNTLTFLFLITIISACETSGNFPIGNYQSFIGDKSVDSEIGFNPAEVFDNSEVAPATLKINFATIKQYPCFNYDLLTTVTSQQDELIIRFDDVEIGPVCLTAIGPARTSVMLPEKTKYLVLINGTDIDEYEIDITEQEINLIPQSTSFSQLNYTKIFRYPKDSFALMCGTNIDNTHLCGDFYNILADSVDISEFEFHGDGKIPYPDSTSGNWRNNASLFFTYSSFEEYIKAGNLLENFSINNLTPNDGVSIYMSSWNNKHFRSWMFD